MTDRSGSGHTGHGAEGVKGLKEKGKSIEKILLDHFNWWMRLDYCRVYSCGLT